MGRRGPPARNPKHPVQRWCQRPGARPGFWRHPRHQPPVWVQDQHLDHYITATTKTVEHKATGGADADDDFRAAVGLLVNQAKPVTVTGAAVDPSFSWELSSLKAKDGAGATSQLHYPQLGFGTDVTSLMGVTCAQSNSVSGHPEAADTKVRAIVGDWSGSLRWGIQRNIPVTLIDRGDPSSPPTRG